MTKKITFHSTMTDFDILKPTTASRSVPPWFRKMNSVTEGIMTVKKCVPFLDALTSGYVIPLAADVFWDKEKQMFGSNAAGPIVSDHHLVQSEDVEIPEEYDSQPHKWISNWHIKTPRGYSCLITHPLNRMDLPFYSFSGIVDTDRHPMVINFPFVLRKNFEGKIDAGTPMVQIIPFKRERWSSGLIDEGPSHFYRNQHKVEEPPFGYYKKNFWDRKYFS
jgi:hypothetical protein